MVMKIKNKEIPLRIIFFLHVRTCYTSYNYH